MEEDLQSLEIPSLLV